MKNILSNKEFLNYTPRNIWKQNWKNDGFRSLNESVIHPDVLTALNDWKLNTDSNYVLIGGLALSYYIKPRPTDDIDLIFLSKKDFPLHVNKFKKTREHAFIHISTQVEVEVLDSTYLKNNQKMYDKAFETSILSDGVRVASPQALIAFKLGRFGLQDKVDIIQLIEYCEENKIEINLEEYGINNDDLNKFKKLSENYNKEYYHNHYMLEIQYYLDNKKDDMIKINENDFQYDIYVMNDGCNIPRFHFGKFDENYMFEIEFDGDDLKITGSSTGYPSFNMYRNEEKDLKKWLSIKSNFEKLNNSINNTLN